MRPKSQETADLVMFTEEILNGKLHFFVQCYQVPSQPKAGSIFLFIISPEAVAQRCSIKRLF